MASISQCEHDIVRYQALKGKINSIASNLSSAVHNVEDATTEIKTKYQINDNSTPLVSRSIQLKSNMENTSAYLTGTIISSIDQAIQNLNAEIERIKEEERRRAEEARRQEEARQREAARIAQEQSRVSNNRRSWW